MKETIYLGIDVSKGYADFILVNRDQELLEDLFQLDDNARGREVLGIKLTELIKSRSGSEVFCGLESTGGYERNWYKYLLTLSCHIPVKVALLNPVVVKGISKASLDRTITDDVSAINIARYLVSYHGKVDYRQGEKGQDPFEDGRSVYSYQKMLNKQKVQFDNQLEKLLYRHFQELLVYCRHGVPNWILHILEKYPTPEKIKKAGIEKLSKLKGIGPKYAKKVNEKASLNHQIHTPDIEFAIKGTVSEILHRKKKIAESKSFLSAAYNGNPLVKLLCTITGIGYDSAISILFEIGDIERFKSAKAMAAYFGVNPEFKQSGDGKWKSSMSKKGKKYIRAVLYMACFSSIRYDPMMKQKYAGIRAKGKNHYFAMGVLMHKMLRVIFGVLKRGAAYDPEIDRKNRERSLEKQANKEALDKQQIKANLKKKRRYQNLQIAESPISKRKAKKLKELETS